MRKKFLEQTFPQTVLPLIYFTGAYKMNSTRLRWDTRRRHNHLLFCYRAKERANARGGNRKPRRRDGVAFPAGNSCLLSPLFRLVREQRSRLIDISINREQFILLFHLIRCRQKRSRSTSVRFRRKL